MPYILPWEAARNAAMPFAMQGDAQAMSSPYAAGQIDSAAQIKQLILELTPVINEIYGQQPDYNNLLEERRRIGEQDGNEFWKGMMMASLASLFDRKNPDAYTQNINAVNQGLQLRRAMQTAADTDIWKQKLSRIEDAQNARKSIMSAILGKMLEKKLTKPDPIKLGADEVLFDPSTGATIASGAPSLKRLEEDRKAEGRRTLGELLTANSIPNLNDREAYISAMKGNLAADAPEYMDEYSKAVEIKRPYKIGQEIQRPEGRTVVTYRVTGFDESTGQPILERIATAEKDRPITLDMSYDKELARKTIMELPKQKALAITNKNNLEAIDRAIKLIKSGVTGKGGQVKAFLAPYAEMLGVDIKNLSDSQTFQLLTRVITGPMRLDIIGPGPVSEWEQKLMMQISGGGGAAKSAALELLNFYRKNAVSKIESYNDAVKGISTLVPNASKIYKQIETPTSRYQIISGDNTQQSSDQGKSKFKIIEVK